MTTLIFATNNQYKVDEIKTVIGDEFNIITLKDAGIDIDIPEPHDSLEKNALEKSSVIHKLTNQNCFSEDTGLEVESVNGEIFMDGMKQLIDLDKNWIPNKKDHSLYIRPFMFSTDCQLGVKPSSTYKFIIILSPSGPYFAEPMKIFVEEKYTRAVPGGVGFAKNAGNYGGSLIAAQEAKKLGYDQVLWTDAFEHKWLQEVGMMNVMFVINSVAITPSLEEGTILKGVTRESVITILKDMGIKVEERRISIDELMDAYKNNSLQEVFGTGTAATISLIKELRYKDFVMKFDVTKCAIANEVLQTLNGIRSCTVNDKFGWMNKI